jgi:hypothetical protein
VAESLAVAIAARGFGLRSMEPARGDDLETLFLRLTGGAT